MEMYMNEIEWLEKLKGSSFIIELFEWQVELNIFLGNNL